MNPSFPLSFTKYIYNYAFIPKDQLKIEEFQGKNIILFETTNKNEEILRSEYQNILNKIKSARVYFSRIDFNSKNNVDQILNKYLELGKEIIRATETQNFIKLISSISNSESPYKDFIDNNKEYRREENKIFEANLQEELPFIFVCASSGTGKTQLPFSVDIPLVYLVNNQIIKGSEANSEIQKIYQNFSHISGIFLKCVELDRNLIYDRNGSYVFQGNYYMCQSMIAGFFVALFKLIFEYRMELRNDEHWAISQLNALSQINDQIEIKRISIVSAKNAICKMTKIYNETSGLKFLPLVFLDESQKSDNDENFTVDYKTIRRIIKNIGLIPVFMGTNASLVNFINKNSLQTSRKEYLDIWGYVVYKLAPPGSIYLSNEKEKAIHTVQSLEYLSMSEKTKVSEFVEKMRSLIEMERPWFCNLVFEYLRNELARYVSSKTHFDPCEFFEMILYHILYQFKSRKNILIDGRVLKEDEIGNYNYCNLSITSPEYFTNESKIPFETNIDRSNGIHNHIAYLFADPEWFEKSMQLNFFPLLLSSDIKVVKLIKCSNELYPDFIPQQIFATFRKEPVGHLAFISLRNTFNSIFVTIKNDNKIKIVRASVNKVFEEMNLKIKSYNHQNTENASNWIGLENKTAVSALIATHTEGFKGVKSSIWLASFFRELDLNADFEKELPELKIADCSDQCKNIILETPVPFCSPTVGAEWMEDFGKYLTANGANLGVLYSFKRNAPRDICIQQSFNSSDSTLDIISGECKYRKDGLASSTIIDVVKNLSNFESKLNLILTNKLPKEISITRKSFVDRYCDVENNIYIFNAIHDKIQNSITLEKIYYHNYNHDTNNLKVFILFSVES